MSSKQIDVVISGLLFPSNSDADESRDNTWVIQPEDLKDGEKKEEKEEVEDTDSKDGINKGVKDTRKDNWLPRESKHEINTPVSILAALIFPFPLFLTNLRAQSVGNGNSWATSG